jgi:hypothetical protein
MKNIWRYSSVLLLTDITTFSVSQKKRGSGGMAGNLLNSIPMQSFMYR